MFLDIIRHCITSGIVGCPSTDRGTSAGRPWDVCRTSVGRLPDVPSRPLDVRRTSGTCAGRPADVPGRTMSCGVVRRRVASYHIARHCAPPYDVRRRTITSYDIVQRHKMLYIVLHRTTWYDATRRPTMPYDVATSYGIVCCTPNVAPTTIDAEVFFF